MHTKRWSFLTMHTKRWSFPTMHTQRWSFPTMHKNRWSFLLDTKRWSFPMHTKKVKFSHPAHEFSIKVSSKTLYDWISSLNCWSWTLSRTMKDVPGAPSQLRHRKKMTFADCLAVWIHHSLDILNLQSCIRLCCCCHHLFKLFLHWQVSTRKNRKGD